MDVILWMAFSVPDCVCLICHGHHFLEEFPVSCMMNVLILRVHCVSFVCICLVGRNGGFRICVIYQ